MDGYKLIIIRFICLSLGVLFIIAGIKGWKFPTIKYRNTEYGEILNTIVMILAGIYLIAIVLIAWVGGANTIF